MQSVSTIIFLYFANLAPIVAFGGLLGDATENRMASIEALVGFAFFPANIEGKTNLFSVFFLSLTQLKVCKKELKFLLNI